MDPHTFVLHRITPCIECTLLTASCQCIVCCDCFCTSCFTNLHKGSKGKHEWIYVLQPHNIPADTHVATFSSNYVTLPSPTVASVTPASSSSSSSSSSVTATVESSPPSSHPTAVSTVPSTVHTSNDSLPFSSSAATTHGVVPLAPPSRRSSQAGSRRSSWQQAEQQEKDDIESFSLQTIGKYVRRASAMGNGVAPFLTIKQGSLKVLTMDEARDKVAQEYTEEQRFPEQTKELPDAESGAKDTNLVEGNGVSSSAVLTRSSSTVSLTMNNNSRRNSVSLSNPGSRRNSVTFLTGNG